MPALHSKPGESFTAKDFTLFEHEGQWKAVRNDWFDHPKFRHDPLFNVARDGCRTEEDAFDDAMEAADRLNYLHCLPYSYVHTNPL